MSSVAGNDVGHTIMIDGQPHTLRYSMASLEKIELQFGSIGEMQKLLTDGRGEIRMDRPVIGLLIDIVHAGLLHDFPNTPEQRNLVAGGFSPGDMGTAVEAMTLAFGDSFGDLLGKATPVPNRADRRAESHGENGSTRPLSHSAGRKKTGKT